MSDSPVEIDPKKAEELLKWAAGWESRNSPCPKCGRRIVEHELHMNGNGFHILCNGDVVKLQTNPLGL